MRQNAAKVDPHHILDNSMLLLPWCCEVVDGYLYELILLDNDAFKEEEFVNASGETYRIDGDKHVYRVFLDVDDYDYVTDPNMLRRLNIVFNRSKFRVEKGIESDAD